MRQIDMRKFDMRRLLVVQGGLVLRRFLFCIACVAMSHAGAARAGQMSALDLSARDLVPSARLHPLGAGAAPGAAEPAGLQISRRQYLVPVLLSAAVPGLGEISTGHWWNGVPFVAAEVATWIGYAHYENEGHRLRDEFELFADQNWSVERWAENLGKHFASDEPGPRWWDPEIPGRCDCSPPFIPYAEDSQEYYENAGKYVHFWPGWADWQYNTANPLASDSQAMRRQYADLRIASNDAFNSRTRMLGVAAATRVLSMVQSMWLVRRDAGDMELRVEPLLFKRIGTGLRMTLRY